MLEADVLDRGGQPPHEAETLHAARASRREPVAQPAKDEATARALQASPVALRPAAPVETEERQPQGDKQRGKGLLHRRPVLFAIGALLLVPLLGGGYLYLDNANHFETTDDAFVAARQSSLAPKVSGYITAVPVTDNQHVAAGAVIAKIDDRDYRIALQQAQAQVAAAQASIDNVDAQRQVQEAQINASQAQVAQAQATLVFAEQQAARYGRLEQTGYGSVQNAQQYAAQLRQQQAALQSAQASLKSAQRQLQALNAQRDSAVANLAQAQAQRAQAQLNLSYTTLTAAQPGRVVNLGAALGQLAQPGADLAMFVPDQLWVTANFKEIQLDRMRPGDPVTLEIDAYPGRTIRGHVDSVQPGSGTAFSLLPAQNATGNYVKIVQRVPVKITMDNPPADVALGPGMSVVPTVRVDPTPSLYEKLRRFL
jgi:membrane fusion protein, multidrug efflux system